MMIRTKGIFHENIKDAPFIGALICSIDCNINCNNCHNQHLKNDFTYTYTSEYIIQEVLSNKFNEGIILGGLEWTLQQKEMIELISLAKKHNLEIMIYTGLDEESFYKTIQGVDLSNVYIKFGKYDEDLICNDNIQYDIKLATSNQKIVRRRIYSD